MLDKILSTITDSSDYLAAISQFRAGASLSKREVKKLLELCAKYVPGGEDATYARACLAVDLLSGRTEEDRAYFAPLELGEGSFKEVVSIGGASFLVIHLLGGGEACVIAHVDAVGRVALGLLQHVVFNVFVIVGQLRGVEALIAYGGYGTVAHQNAGVPDNQNGGDDGGNDADGPIELRFGSTGLVSV